MSAGLIKHLKEKTEQDPNTKILMSQWEFDEKLLGKSLENVGSYYPHFSSHNESHSQQILVNIERLLGDNISKLTATDTWLILEAAYWHDIGMLFSADDVQEVVNNEEFKDYVEELANNNAQDLHEFAKVWHNEGWEVALVSYDNPYKGVEKYRQMVAEWYRRDHPQNSQQVVLKPFEKLNISSPRTELLPQRIYRYLAQICLSHGKSFNYVMSELPFRQTGMGTENCHPRFVACMLRLGDLFDIDDNRFCPVMARQVGNMPSLSETHKHKHQAIREFQLDNETVSVTAICDTEISYIECRRWFDWIKEEIQDQMSQWKNIVPSRDFGLLPTINKLDVEMADSKVLLNNKPMKFSLDEHSAIELLQGKNLYDDESNIYRELIQNAIDATYIRAWIEFGKGSTKQKLNQQSNPYSKEFLDIVKDFPISISFTKEESETDSDYAIWKFSISDKGTGISLKDLEYMQQIAGSSKNIQRKKIINSMPVALRPSGTFGIGLHSAFLLIEDNEGIYNKINIETKSIFDNSSYNIEMTSPISSNQGYCFIKKTDSNTHRDFGTTISLHIKVKRRGKRFNSNLLFNPSYERKYVFDIQNSYDSLKHPIFDYLSIILKIGAIRDNIINNTPVPININDKFDNSESITNCKTELIWDDQYNLFFGIRNCEKINFLKNPSYYFSNLFKGQEVQPIIGYYLLPVFVDFYAFDAKEALQLDRNKWRQEFTNSLFNSGYFDDLLKHLLNNYLDFIRSQLNNDNYLSAILSLFDNIEYPSSLKDLWTELPFFDEDESKFSSDLSNTLSFNEILNLSKVNIIEVKSKNSPRYISFDSNQNISTLVTTSFNVNEIWSRKLIESWYENSGVVEVRKIEGSTEYYFKKVPDNSNNLIVLFCEDYLKGEGSRMSLSKSSLKDAGLSNYLKLCCSSKAHYNIFGKTNSSLKNELLLFPFTKFVVDKKTYISTHNLDILIDSVYEDLRHKNDALDRKEINESYRSLITLIDDKMSTNEEWTEARKLGENFKPKDILTLREEYGF